MGSEDKITHKSKTWYAQHPLVSTFLWVLGNRSNDEEGDVPELPAQRNSSTRLHWKDEYDGDICDVVAEEVKGGVVSPMTNHASTTALRRNESKKFGTFVS